MPQFPWGSLLVLTIQGTGKLGRGQMAQVQPERIFRTSAETLWKVTFLLFRGQAGKIQAQGFWGHPKGKPA